MNICKHCGGKTPDGTFYCVYCGKLFDNVEKRDVISHSEYMSLQKDSEELRQKIELLDDLRKHGYAPSSYKLILESDYGALTESRKLDSAKIDELNAKLSKIYAEGYAPLGMRLISETEYERLKSSSKKTSNSSSFPSWILWLVGVVVIGYLCWQFIGSGHNTYDSSDKDVVSEILSLPDNLAGYYMVKEQDGKDGNGVAAKVLQEDGQYSMSIYSSTITRKYFFAYNKETGTLSSEELGKGKVEYTGKINQIKISFSGWILVK